jgi:CheY-like chemotaxis protein
MRYNMPVQTNGKINLETHAIMIREPFHPCPAGGEGRERDEQAGTFHGNGERVLFLDDEEPIVLLASRMLKRLGFEVETHTSAPEAMASFRRAPASFDLVLTDLSMPGASGLEFAREVLALRPNIPVVLTTGYIDPGDLEKARAIGVREIILKPTTIEEMGRAFHRLLSAPSGQLR